MLKIFSSVTNGELSNNSIGITRLDYANIQKVKGGLGYSDIKRLSSSQAGVFAEYQEKNRWFLFAKRIQGSFWTICL